MATTTKQTRFAITFHPNDPILTYLEDIKKMSRGLFSYPDIIKQAIKLKFDIDSKSDLTLQDIQRIGWDNISTQELIDRYPPYRNGLNDSIDNYTPAPKDEVEAFAKQFNIKL